MSRIPRKDAEPLGNAIRYFLKVNHMTTGFNTHLVNSAWDRASGAAEYTIKRYYRDGTLYITLNSSVVRSQLQFQQEALIERINHILRHDALFDPEDKFAGYVKKLVIK